MKKFGIWQNGETRKIECEGYIEALQEAGIFTRRNLRFLATYGTCTGIIDNDTNGDAITVFELETETDES